MSVNARNRSIILSVSELETLKQVQAACVENGVTYPRIVSFRSREMMVYQTSGDKVLLMPACNSHYSATTDSRGIFQR